MKSQDDAMHEYMAWIVYSKHRPFCYLDFLHYQVDGLEYHMAHGTFRNKVTKLIKKGKVEVSYRSGPTFYTLKGCKFGKTMTPNHVGVSPRNSFYQMINDLPLEKNSLHDIRLWFKVPGIWSLLSTNSYHINPRNKDIRLPGIYQNDLFIGVTVHRPDTVSVVVSCSYMPIAVDVNGIIRLTNALTVVTERLSSWIKESGILVGRSEFKDLIIPPYAEWIVKMWHFGADGRVEYCGEKFEISFDNAKEVLVRIYSKQMMDKKTRIRMEKQECPNIPLADAIDNKLYRNSLQH